MNEVNPNIEHDIVLCWVILLIPTYRYKFFYQLVCSVGLVDF